MDRLLIFKDRQKLLNDVEIEIVVKCCRIQESDLRKACEMLGIDYREAVADLENDYDIIEEIEKGEK